MENLSGKTALVTGSTDGVGRLVARKLGQAGARVLVHGRDAERGAGVVADIETSGGAADFLAADLSALAEVRRLADATQAPRSGLCAHVAAAFRPRRGCVAPADQLVRGEFRLSDGGRCSQRAAERRRHPPSERESRRPLCRNRDRGGGQRRPALCRSVFGRTRRKPRGAPADLFAQRVFQPPGAAAASAARPPAARQRRFALYGSTRYRSRTTRL